MKIIISALLVLFSLPVASEELIAFSDSQRKAMNIQTAPLQSAGTRISTNYPGKVAVPNAQLHVVTAPQQGLVETLLAAEGENVTKGQVLARIQSPALLDLQSEYLEVYTRYQLAKSNYERDRMLNEEGIIAERRLLESKSKYKELQTSLSRVKRMLELSGMDRSALSSLRKSREPDSVLEVIAPFGGVVLEQMTNTGTRVEAADAIYRIASLMPLWLEVHMPLEQLGDVRIGHSVIVPSLGVSGRIITIGKMVHGADQGVLVRAEIHDGAEKLHPGQFLQVQLAIVSEQDTYRVPRSAVVRNQGKTYIFTAQANGFLPVQVKLAGEEVGTLVIEVQLPAQARIVTAGTVAIKAAWLSGE